MYSEKQIIDYYEKKYDDWNIDREKKTVGFTHEGEYKEYGFDLVVKVFRKQIGQSFECIYSEHVELVTILKCTECGTVIFTRDDEDFEDNLRCPTCSDYKTGFKYWTGEEIKQDQEKQKVIDMYKDMMKYQIEQYKRMERRNGKYDWMLARVKKLFETSKGFWSLDVEVDNITNKFPLKGLRLKFTYWKKESEFSAIWKKNIRIPLSWSAFYIQCVYKHLGKCHPSMRSKWYIGKPKEPREEKVS